MGILPDSWFPKWRDPNDDVWQALWRSAISEFFATAIFIFIGTGSVTSTQAALGLSNISVPSLTVIALAHGFCIMVMVYTIGEISGGHINPIITWAVLITQKISVLRALIYWVSQFLGGIIGSLVLRGLLPVELRFGMGCHTLNSALKPVQGWGCEVIFTFIFVFVVFATAISPFVGKIAPLSGGSDYGPGKLTPFVVGMTILILHTVGIPLTGASMNPARSFGPALVQGGVCWNNHWIYWIGPLFGSTCAALVAQVIFLSQPAAMLQMFKLTRNPHQGQQPISTSEHPLSSNEQQKLVSSATGNKAQDTPPQIRSSSSNVGKVELEEDL